MGSDFSCIKGQYVSVDRADEFYGWKLCIDPLIAKQKYINEGFLTETYTLEQLELSALLDSPIAVRYMLRYSKAPQVSCLISLWLDCQDWLKKKTLGAPGLVMVLIKHKSVSFAVNEAVGQNPFVLEALYDEISNVQYPGQKLVMRIFNKARSVCFDQLFTTVYVPFMETTAYARMCKLICDPNSWVTATSFTYGKMIARGGFGVVVQCEKKSTGVAYAMKIQPKTVLLNYFNHDKERVMTEMHAYAECDHPNVAKLAYAFQTSMLTMLVMPISRFGDLARALSRSPNGVFSFERVQFHAAEIVSALTYLHSFGLIYRDLKLANILLNDDGSVQLADFGSLKDVEGELSRKFAMNQDSLNNNCHDKEHSKFQTLDGTSYRSKFQTGLAEGPCTGSPVQLGASPNHSLKRANSLVGTREYMAPEIIFKFGSKTKDRTYTSYTPAVDWWSFGILIYQMLTGNFPFASIPTNQLEVMLPNVLADPNTTDEDKFYRIFGKVNYELDSLSHFSVQIIKALLQVNPQARLGCIDAQDGEMMHHPFFQGIDWVAIREHSSVPPFIPSRDGLMSVKHSNDSVKFENFSDLLCSINQPEWISEDIDVQYEPGFDAVRSPRHSVKEGIGLESSLSHSVNRYKIKDRQQGHFFCWNYVSPDLVEGGNIMSISNDGGSSYGPPDHE